MLIAHRIALDPTNAQRTHFARASGTARFAWNWVLSQRLFHCDECGYEAGRDYNAARNLENLAASFAVSACGAERSGAVRKPRVKRASVRQEPDIKAAA
ncbi:helix-turn-helix domain-containing protein [Acidocella sp.]|uniref:helix-turn-helix domain-containing protein n=1 Tax=Acidocella sp. TaxID=50710 RepID=UPI00262FE34B|nr:helix-turn-helix domain-containing protein [Acidocella sp.]